MPTAGRSVFAAVLLVIGAGLGVLAVLVHYGLLAEYGDVTDTAFEGLIWGFTAGVSGVALFLVAGVAVIGLVFSTRRWMQVTAVAIPVLVLLGMLAVTPAALGQQLERFDSRPHCALKGADGPVATVDRESQRAFDSIEHIGYFGGGGRDGVGGCSRMFVVRGDVDVLQHYRAALPAAGWEVVEDDGRHLRAHRNGQAFDVRPCPGGGVVWAGRDYAPAFRQGWMGLMGSEFCRRDH